MLHSFIRNGLFVTGHETLPFQSKVNVNEQGPRHKSKTSQNNSRSNAPGRTDYFAPFRCDYTE